jgi:hypothetical protein
MGSAHVSSVKTPIWLVVLTCFNHLYKFELVNGKDDIPFIMENKPRTVYVSLGRSLLISLTQNRTGSVPLGSRNSSSRSINLEGDGAIVVGGYDLAI